MPMYQFELMCQNAIIDLSRYDSAEGLIDSLNNASRICRVLLDRDAVEQSMSTINAINECVLKIEDLYGDLDPVKWLLIDFEAYLVDLGDSFSEALKAQIHGRYSEFGRISADINGSLGKAQKLLAGCEKALDEISSGKYRDYFRKRDPDTGKMVTVYLDEVGADDPLSR